MAERLGITVTEMMDRMPAVEFDGWVALWTIRGEESEVSGRGKPMRRK